MTLARIFPASADQSTRWLVLASLALNLFFTGLISALVVRHYVWAPSGSAATVDRSVAGRIDRLAATLPAEDAEKLRAEFRIQAAAVEETRAAYRRSQDAIRRTLRSEPFGVEAMRVAMTESRAARQTFDQSLHGVIAAAAARMSATGRNKLADWPPNSRTDGGTRR